MAETTTVAGVDRTSVVDPRHVDFAESAYLGETLEGSFIVNDTAGSLVIPAHKPVVVEQSSTTPSRIFSGFVRSKKIGRSVNPSEVHPMGASRAIRVGTVDANSLLRRKIIRRYSGMTKAEGGVRPAETVAARLTWLLAGPWLSGLVADYGAVTYPAGVGLDSARLMGQYPGDVLVQMAKACRFSGCYVRYNAAQPLFELVFRDDNASTADTCTISISNAGNADGDTIFAPNEDAELDEDGEHVYSGMYATHRKGAVFESRAATATAYADRDGTTEDAGARNASTARRDAQTALWESRSEEQSLPVRLRVPKAKIGLIRQGMRISTRMVHMAPEGWDPARYARILRRRWSKPLAVEDVYDLLLDLSPQEAAPPAATIVQSDFGGTGEAGANLTLPNPVTVGNLLIFCASDRSGTNPGAPNTSSSRPRFGAGAWTLINTGTVRNRANGDGIAFWGKVADATDRIGYIGLSNARCGIWEISAPNAAATLAAITVVAVADQVNALVTAQTLTTGALGTLASGQLGLYCTNWQDQTNGGGSPPEDPPAATMAAGWERRLFEPAYYGGGVITQHSPYTVIADAVGAGSAVTAAVTRSKLNRTPDGFTFTGAWCGMALKVVPQ